MAEHVREARPLAARRASVAADWRASPAGGESAAANRGLCYVHKCKATVLGDYVTMKCLRMHGPAGCSTFENLTPRKGGTKKKRELKLLRHAVAFPWYTSCYAATECCATVPRRTVAARTTDKPGSAGTCAGPEPHPHEGSSPRHVMALYITLLLPRITQREERRARRAGAEMPLIPAPNLKRSLLTGTACAFRSGVIIDCIY